MLSLLAAQLIGGSLNYRFVTLDVQSCESGPVTAVFQSWSAPQRGDFGLIRYRLLNGAAAPAKVAIEVRSGGAPATARTLELPARGTRTVLLPLSPSLSVAETQVRVSGKECAMHHAVRTRRSALVLALGDEPAFEKSMEARPGYYGDALDVETLPLDALPLELAALVAWDAIVLLGKTFESLAEPPRRALETYAATGGALILASASRATPDHLPLLASNKEGPHAYGFGTVRLCYKDTERCAAGLASDAAQREVLIALRETRVGRADHQTLLPMRGVPVGAFLAIVGLFALCVGPGSLWVARRVHLSALLITIPAIAALTTAALVGYSVAREGISTRAATCGYTLIDRDNSRAVRLGIGGFFGPFAARGVRLELGSSLVGAAYQSVAMHWDRAAALGEDFLPARTYREWGWYASGPSRARLVAKAHPSGLLVQNALGAPVKRLRVRQNGVLWGVDDLPEGGEAIATVASAAALDWPAAACRGRFGSRANVSPASLRDNEFLAALDAPAPVPLASFEPSLEAGAEIVQGEVTP